MFLSYFLSSKKLQLHAISKKIPDRIVGMQLFYFSAITGDYKRLFIPAIFHRQRYKSPQNKSWTKPEDL